MSPREIDSLDAYVMGICIDPVASRPHMLDNDTYFILKDRISAEELFVVETYYLDNKTLNQTAKITKMPETRVYSIIDKALLILETQLRKRT